MKRFFLQLNDNDKQILKNAIGKSIVGVLEEHSIYAQQNPLQIRPYMSVWIHIEKNYIEFHNEETSCAFQNDGDYIEDIATFSVIDKGTVRPKHYLQDEVIDEFKIDEKINDIQIVTNTYYVKESEEKEEELVYDVAIVFILETQRLVFERNICFSEVIDVTSQSLDSELKLLSEKNCDEFNDECETKFSQTITSLKE